MTLPGVSSTVEPALGIAPARLSCFSFLASLTGRGGAGQELSNALCVVIGSVSSFPCQQAPNK